MWVAFEVSINIVLYRSVRLFTSVNLTMSGLIGQNERNKKKIEMNTPVYGNCSGLILWCWIFSRSCRKIWSIQNVPINELGKCGMMSVFCFVRAKLSETRERAHEFSSYCVQYFVTCKNILRRYGANRWLGTHPSSMQLLVTINYTVLRFQYIYSRSLNQSISSLTRECLGFILRTLLSFFRDRCDIVTIVTIIILWHNFPFFHSCCLFLKGKFHSFFNFLEKFSRELKKRC